MITRDQADTCAHVTYMEVNVLFASVVGVIERVNKLISVTPVNTRYNEEIDSAGLWRSSL